jgi:hypothetical protein
LRERWGVHASELEVLGVPFPESERRAHEFVLMQEAGELIQDEETLLSVHMTISIHIYKLHPCMISRRMEL